MAVDIHSTAIVDSSAELDENVSVGPFSIIEANTQIGSGTSIGSHAFIGWGTRLGKNLRIFHGASIGTIPQDLKFAGEETTLHIGDNTIIREFCTLNRGTKEAGVTKIGANCALLAYCHVAHDCIVGDNVIVSNNLAMAGHVHVGNFVGIGGVVAIHQFCRVGDYAFIQAGTRLVKDVLPFAMIGGDPADPKVVGVNTVGLQRRGFDSDRRNRIRRAYRILFKKAETVEDGVRQIEEMYPDDSDIKSIISFVKNSERGIARMAH
ncbi:MAG: acyl-ACP--UDP-N-acetylglucosamine O-acyltransferase [Fibrobacterota bacterium]